jgi:hypothetical protein
VRPGPETQNSRGPRWSRLVPWQWAGRECKGALGAAGWRVPAGQLNRSAHSSRLGLVEWSSACLQPRASTSGGTF